MSLEVSAAPAEFGDPLSRPFWAAARQGRLIVQRCTACGHHQFPARIQCTRCHSAEVTWRDALGGGSVYAVTTVRMTEPAYQVAVVELAEGPRLIAGIAGEPVAVGDRVEVIWRERENLPPFPDFTRAREGDQ